MIKWPWKKKNSSPVQYKVAVPKFKKMAYPESVRLTKPEMFDILKMYDSLDLDRYDERERKAFDSLINICLTSLAVMANNAGSYEVHYEDE